MLMDTVFSHGAMCLNSTVCIPGGRALLLSATQQGRMTFSIVKPHPHSTFRVIFPKDDEKFKPTFPFDEAFQTTFQPPARDATSTQASEKPFEGILPKTAKVKKKKKKHKKFMKLESTDDGEPDADLHQP